MAGSGKRATNQASRATATAPTTTERAMWTVLAAIPAGLVIAVTAGISVDLAAAPFLWVLPPSLYLLTFVAICREGAWVAHKTVAGWARSSSSIRKWSASHATRLCSISCRNVDRLSALCSEMRLTLTALPERYDLIVLDAFSSDAIPVHFLTREAFAGYLSHLTGVIVLHISNRHMALRGPAAVGLADGLVAFGKLQVPPAKTEEDARAASDVVVFARDVKDLGDLPWQGWTRLDPSSRVAWTDDYANILRAVLDARLGR